MSVALIVRVQSDKTVRGAFAADGGKDTPAGNVSIGKRRVVLMLRLAIC